MRWTTTRARARSRVTWPKNSPRATEPSAINGLCWIYAGLTNLAVASSDFFLLIIRSQRARTLFLLRTVRLSLTSMISIMAGSFGKIADCQAVLAQANELEAQRILLGVGFLANELQHLFGVRSHRRAARRRGLVGQLDDSPRGGRRIEAAVLHVVESCREALECLSVQIALLRRHPARDPCERRGRFRRTPGSHIACRRHHDVDAKTFQLGPVDGRENFHRRLRCAGRPVERKRKARGPGADLYDAAACGPQRRQECVHDGQSAEYIDFELMPDGVERQNFQRSWGENAGIVDQEIKAATAKRFRHAGGPGFHVLFLGDVADRQADAAAGGLFQLLDLRGRDRGTENDITLGCEPKRDVAAKAAAGAGDRSGPVRSSGCH